MTYKKLSIITVCLNAVDTIERTINSVLNQSYNDYEYIIIDGGSTDGTIRIIEKYSDQLAYWESEKDRGIYDAMNKGVRHAEGDAIGFINANDWYSDNIFEGIVNAFNSMNCDIIYGDLMLCSNGEKKLYSNKSNKLFDFSDHFPIIQPSSFVRANLLKNYPFDTNYKIVSDAKWYWLAHIRKFKFLYLEQVVSNFSIGGVSSNLGKVLPEWKKAATEVNLLEIERSFQYWKLIDRTLEKEFELELVDHLKKIFDSSIDIVGSGTVFDRLLPYLEQARIKICNIYDDRIRKISYCNKDIETLPKVDICNMNGDIVFITSEECSNTIAEQICYNPLDQRVVLFPTFFTDVVEIYLNTRK